MKKRFKTIGMKLAVLVTLFSLILCIAIGVFSYLVSWREYTDFYSQKAQETAALAATFVDGDKIGTYLETGETDDYYESLRTIFNNIKQEQNVLYLYIFKPDETSFTYILEAQIPSDDPENISQMGDIYEYQEAELENLLPDVEAKKASTEKLIAYNPAYGAGVMAWAPVLDSQGNVAAYVEADLSLYMVLSKLRSYVLNLILICCIIILAGGVVLIAMNRRMVAQPMAQLTRNVLEFASGESLAYPSDAIQTGDEMQSLSEAFGKMAKDIDNYTKNLAAVAADKERIATELSLATDIQISLLPRAFPAFPNRDEFDIYAQLQPAKVVGGDFYDFFLIDQNHLGVVTGGVSGKGIPAALFMVVAKTIIKNQLMTGMDIEEAMSVINTRLFESKTPGVVVQAFVGVLDTRNGNFSYVNAGQAAPLYMRKDRPFAYLEGQQMGALAETENVRYRKMELTFRQGDRLVLCSNGVFEAQNPQGQEFGKEKLRKDLNARRSKLNDLKTLVNVICDDVSAYEEAPYHQDDVTVLALAYHKGDRARAEISVRAREDGFPQAQRFLRRQLEENGLGGAFYAKMSVATEEAFSMAVRNTGGRGEIVVRCAVDETPDGQQVTVTILYAGPQANPLLEQTGVQQDALAFIQRSMDTVSYRYQDGRNEISLQKRAE